MIRLSHIQRFSIHDGPGIRTTVFLKGCSLGCLWCHNPETISALPTLQYFEAKCVGCGFCAQICPRGAIGSSLRAKRSNPVNLHSLSKPLDCFGRNGLAMTGSSSVSSGESHSPLGIDSPHLSNSPPMEGCPPGGVAHKVVINRTACTACGLCAGKCPAEALVVNGENIAIDNLFETIIRDKNFYDRSGGGVTISGGEPLLQAGEVAVLLEKCKASGIHTAIDTAGNVGFGCFERVLDYTDLFLYDLKIMDPKKHKRYTGAENGLIHENLARLSKTGKNIIIRILLIPGVNDDAREARLRDDFLRRLHGRHTVEYLPMHTMAKSKYESLGMYGIKR